MAPRQLVQKILGLFSSIWLGVTLLSLLFVYCSVGSSGVPTRLNIFDPGAWVSVRQLRPFELTEFEWFHWWPFDLLMILICTNVTVATLRRIPLKVVNLGVWMIHSGIIILCLGSVYYFSTKLEGDTPVPRRQLMIQTPDGQRATMTALPGAQQTIQTATGRYEFRVTSIDPRWELLSGADAGARAYSVNLMVQTPQQQFIRQLIAGYPQYTEDLVRTEDPNQPFKRAVKELGTALVDETLAVDLNYYEQDRFYLMDTRAVYLREVGSSEWIMRPVDNIPRYNDRISDYDQVWFAPSDLGPGGLPQLPLSTLAEPVPPVDASDPLAGVDFQVTGFLRYAFDEARRTHGGSTINPMLSLTLETTDGRAFNEELAAFDANKNTAQGGLVSFVWADSAAATEALRTVAPESIRVVVAGAEVDLVMPIGAIPESGEIDFTPIEGTDYAYRIMGVQHGLAIRPGVVDHVAIVDIRSPERTFRRWVFEDPTLTRDLPEGANMPGHEDAASIDDQIQTFYRPGRRPAAITLIAGPGEQDLALLTLLDDGVPQYRPISVGERVALDAEISLTVRDFHATSDLVTKPIIVPRAQRDRDMGVFASMIRVSVPDGGRIHNLWLPYHHYAFSNAGEALRRFPFQPKPLRLADGREIELIFSRQSRPLIAPVALDDFVLDTHVGGFTGQVSSILDWTSMVTFKTAGGWTPPIDVHMNAPKEHRGFWFFQAQWDPPEPPRFQGDPGSAGLNYTVLGVGNRNGVAIQLLGCCIAVIGMIYAFYVKPVIKRRRQRAVYEAVAVEHVETGANGELATDVPMPQPALSEDQS